MKDDGGTKRYLTEKQLFAFAGRPIAIQDKNDSLILYAYAKVPPVQLPLTSGAAGNRARQGNAAADKRLKFQTSLENEQQNLLSEFFITVDQPLRLFDSSKIRLYTDSTYTEAEGYAFKKDSTNKKKKLLFNKPPQEAWKENTRYHIILDRDFAEDSSGKKLLKTDTLSFTTRKKSDYGFLKLKLRNLDMTKNPVLIFYNSSGILHSYPLAGPDFSVPLFLPGEYDLRILYDTNKNGKWDPGIFFGKHQQPEIGRPIERKLTIKPGWQNEFEIAL